MPNRLRDNLRQVRERVEAACDRAGRPPGSVRLVAVTKSVPPEVCAELIGLGQLDLGESRAQNLQTKASWCAERGLQPRWHFLGHLQRNKARSVVRLADEVHSLDSLRLLETLERVAQEEGRRLGVYLEIDYTASGTRTGLPAGDLAPLLELARTLEQVDLLGLMTMAPLPQPGDDPSAAAREVFGRLVALRDELPAEVFRGGRARLSMGMSSDFELAVACGADLVRVGSALFEGLAPSPSAGEVERAPPGGGP